MRSKYERLVVIENILLDELILKSQELSYILKAGFNPDQPRIPSGNPNGGQWAGGSGTLSKVPDSWANPDVERFKWHLSKHKDDFGAKSANDYARRAQKFRIKGIKEKLPTLKYPKGEIGIYDPKTNTFGIYRPDGKTITFYKPTSLTYFQRQIDEYLPQGGRIINPLSGSKPAVGGRLRSGGAVGSNVLFYEDPENFIDDILE